MLSYGYLYKPSPQRYSEEIFRNHLAVIMSSTLDSPYGSGYGVKVNHAGTYPSIRQPPGSACQYCRNKKLKCDARQPQCGTCLASGVECIRSIHSRKRGSRKDHMKVLQDRIGVRLILHSSSEGSRVESLALDLDLCRYTQISYCNMNRRSRTGGCSQGALQLHSRSR